PSGTPAPASTTSPTTGPSMPWAATPRWAVPRWRSCRSQRRRGKRLIGDPAMQTIAEFQAATRRGDPRVVWACFAVLFGAPLLAMRPALIYGWVTAPPGVPPIEMVPGWAHALILVAFLVLELGGFVLLARWMERHAAVRCPHCAASLDGRSSLVVCSRH